MAGKHDHAHDLAGFEVVRTLKRDLFGRVDLCRLPDGILVVRRDTTRARWWTRGLAWWLAAREARALRVLAGVAPALKDRGSRINLENHGDTTTFELVRLAEQVGPEQVGICLDTANLFVFAEHPVDAVRRAAPYVHMTHTKDAIVFFCDSGLQRQGRPVGQGCIDWETILPILGEHEPGLQLSIEDHKWFFYAHVFQDEWLAQQQDLSRDELARTLRLAWQTEQRIRTGALKAPMEYEKTEYADEMEERLSSGRDYLRGLLHRLKLTD